MLLRRSLILLIDMKNKKSILVKYHNGDSILFNFESVNRIAMRNIYKFLKEIAHFNPKKDSYEVIQDVVGVQMWNKDE